MTGRPTGKGRRRPSELGLPLLLVLTGAGLLRTTVFSDVYLRYVKEGLWPYLVTSGAFLVVLGLAGIGAEAVRRTQQPLRWGAASDRGLWREPHDERTDTDDGCGHEHNGATRVAWLLAAPALALLFVAPPALGSYTASRDGAAARVERTAYEELGDAPATPMALEEFIGRSIYDTTSLHDRKVLLTGFATPGRSPDIWYLNRLVVSCCAGDAMPLRVEMRGSAAPPKDTWVTVAGVWRAGEVTEEHPVPAFEIGDLRTVAEPRNPYEDAPPSVD
ncbi:TIGR03943 family putative permease subunit [Streptomyces sp. bgisy034]|uniref:TIGR03943 family putative permease subunit n=1 Tax=Streptomyces sp. bgisy034 TaxID=3413774 RepID=UPI003EBC6C61